MRHADLNGNEDGRLEGEDENREEEGGMIHLGHEEEAVRIFWEVERYCVSSISIALVYIPGASGDHSKSEGCTKATPPPIAAGADH